MRLIFFTEARFIRNSLGVVFSLDTVFSNELWKRYLLVFDTILVVARVKSIENFQGKQEFIASSERVEFLDLPYYIGPLDFLRNMHTIKKIINSRITLLDSVILLRVPSTIALLSKKYLSKNKKTYGLEVVGDPWDVFAPGVINHPFRSFIRIFSYLSLKRIVQESSAVLYVTKISLQRRYPVKQGVFVTNASNVKINISNYAEQPKHWQNKHPWKLISIGSLAQMYKGPDTVLKAIKLLETLDINCELTWLGDGKFKNDMILLSNSLKIRNKINFLGNVDANQVRDNLINSDLFVLASKTEGLPRAVIEAMATGLPCIGTNVGGIPELLDKAVLVPKGCEKSLAQKIEEVLLNPTFYNQQAARNLNEARNYSEDILSQRRNLFYKYILENL